MARPTVERTIVPSPGLQVATTLTDENSQTLWKAATVRAYNAALEDEGKDPVTPDEVARRMAGRAPQ